MRLTEAVPPLITLILLLTIISAIMSTIDSILLSATSLLVRDIYQRYIKPEVASRSWLGACSGGEPPSMGLSAA